MEGPLAALQILPIDLVGSTILAVCTFIFIISFPKKKDIHDISGPISSSGREALAVHKYKSSDYTFLDNILNPWWNWAAAMIPQTIAPNVVTLLGWLFYVPAAIYIVWFSTSFVEGSVLNAFEAPQLPPYPRIVFFIGAIAILWYQTFDAMDGKQARKLGVAGPLGQIMDHGCDAISTVLATILTATALRVDFPGYIMVAFLLLTGFYIGNWAEKYTHVLMTSVSPYFGVTESQYLAFILLFLPSIFGPNFWAYSLQHYFGYMKFLQYPSQIISSVMLCISKWFQPIFPHFTTFLQRVCVGYDLNNLPAGYIIIWILFIAGLYTLALCSYQVIQHIFIDTRIEFELEMEKNRVLDDEYRRKSYRRGDTNAYEQPSQYPEPENLTIISIRRCIVAHFEPLPFFFILITSMLWYTYSLPNPSIGKDWYGAFFYHPLLSLLACSMITVHLICQVIINSMSYSPNELFQPLIIPMVLLQLIDIYPSFMAQPQPLLAPELHFVVWTTVVIACFLTQIRYALLVVQQISNIFGIYILKLGPKTSTPPVLQIRAEIEARSN